MRKSNTKDRDILRNLDDDAMLLLEKVYGNGYEFIVLATYANCFGCYKSREKS